MNYKTCYCEVRHLRCFAAVTHVVVLLCRIVDSRSSYALVTGTEGHIVGELVEQGAIFRGIPFSQPPLGEWRWKRPRYPIPYDLGLWNATYARPGCPQVCDRSLQKYICSPTTSEDCLYLNVWIPRRLLRISEEKEHFCHEHFTVDERFTSNGSESLAVMFYMHGGNYRMGSGSAMLYDGRFLASRGDVIVVTTNFSGRPVVRLNWLVFRRLGAIGFLAHPNLQDVNFGIWDQIQALKWVQSNIAAFGGNPKKITAVGQSSGAESVAIMMTSSYGKGLFQRAIIQSDPWSVPYRTLSEAQKLGEKVAEEVGCQRKNMTCLKSKSANDIIKAAGKVGGFDIGNQEKILVAFQMWGPVIDGDLLPRLPLSSFTEGDFHDMPLIIGNVKNDGNLFVEGAFTHPLGQFIYDFILRFIGGKLGASVADDYPSCSSCDNRKQLSKIATDYAFTCPSRKVSFQKGNNTWNYVFNARFPWKGIFKEYHCQNVVCHGAELPYLFDTASLTNLTPLDKHERVLSHKMQRYWTNFVKHGNPNGKNGKDESSSIEHWERFSNGDSSKPYYVIELSKHGNVMLRNDMDKTCDFWDSLNSYGKY